MNIIDSQTIHQVSALLKEISAPARLKILLAIGREEICVCHLEANLGMRQAYLSQHLMALRQAGVLVTNRDGRFINYRLANPKILEVIRITANSLNISYDEKQINRSFEKQCTCPRCQRFDQVVFPTP
jgi:DNA-binding transcriptional ArsR family regulator